MNTPQVLHLPKIGLVIVVLVLLVASLLAVSIPLAWSLFSAPRSPAPIQADPLKMVDAFPVSRFAANEEA